MRQYVVFNIGRKMKDMSQIISFKKHVLREYDTPNADSTRSCYNRILIGNTDLKEDFRQYTEGIKFRANAVLARDIILATSHEYMLNMPDSEKERWLTVNKEFLIWSFGENCRLAISHRDEFQPLHIHAMIVPRFKNKKDQYCLSNNRYFDGIQKMTEWQDKYYDFISKEFEGLNRGIKHSKAEHISIRRIYGVVAGETDPRGMTLEEALKAYDLMKIKYDALEERLEKYTKQLQIKDKKIEELQSKIINPAVNNTIKDLQESFVRIG